MQVLKFLLGGVAVLALVTTAEAKGHHHGGGRWARSARCDCYVWHPDALEMLSPPGPIRGGGYGYVYFPQGEFGPAPLPLAAPAPAPTPVPVPPPAIAP